MAETTAEPLPGDPQELTKQKQKQLKKMKGSDSGIRPARRQVDPSTVSENERPPQTGNVFNIWYLKWSGGDKESSSMSQVKADGRCNIAKDSGYTRADSVANSYFCLYFARGLCINGKSCDYLHRLPTVTDIFPSNVDCFGRDKFADYREDMGGVGSILKQNRTLYIGRIHVSSKMEEIVNRHFSEWGEIERTRVLNDRGVAFVTYRNEANAQFAREAMAHQSLDHDEVLNVRWATEDPNPLAKRREQKRMEENTVEAIKRLLPEYSQASSGNKRRKELTGPELVSAPNLKVIEFTDDQDQKDNNNKSAGKGTDGREKDAQQDKDQEDENKKEEDSGLISAKVLESLKTLTAKKTASKEPKEALKTTTPKKKTLVSYSDSESD